MTPVSESEARLLPLIAAGLKNQEIAERLQLSPNTVRIAVMRAFRRRGFHKRTELAVAYARAVMQKGQVMSAGNGQVFRADDARKANGVVEEIRRLLDNQPIAVAASIVDTVKDDVHRQLQFGRDLFGVQQ